MDVSRAPQNKKLKFLLQNSLQARMAASSVSILAALLCSVDVAAAPGTWVNGSAFDPAKVALDKIPTPVIGLDGDKTWVQAGEVTDAAGKSITFEVTDASGKVITGAISEAQFQQLKNVVGDTTTLRIDQKSNRLILNWKDFDIGKNSEVKFVQPSTTSLALNKISDSTSPSAIMGKLTANGGVYLINSNGIVFGENSQVNVGSLVASSLDVSDEIFLEKSLGDAIKDDKAAFSIQDKIDAVNDVLNAGVDSKGNVTLTKKTARDDNTIAMRGDIAIEKGAKITSSTLNGVVVVAPNVVNAGDIKSPDGQTILAATKDDAFVLFSSDPSLRGLLIEVNTGGNINNLGNIIAERGNVTLAGIAINHSGHIKATTSVDFNGTVRLLARDSLALEAAPTTIKSIDQVSALLDPNSTTPAVTVAQNNKNYRVAHRGGDVTLNDGATIEVAPELDSKKTAPDAQAQGLSGVEISANKIELQDNASIVAKGGNVFLEATGNLSAAFEVPSSGNPTGYLYNLPLINAENEKKITTQIILGKNSLIDVSGVQVDLPMERNVVEVELRGNELADSPLQRGGFLNGKKVLVDVRKGTPLTDITAALAAVPKQVGERLTHGGKINIRSAGEVITQSGSNLDVSGGGVHYAAGYVATTNLISEGKVINIADADPTRIYSGILGKETATNKRFNITQSFNNPFLSSDRGEFFTAFDQGDAAGSLIVTTQAASLESNVHAGVFTGPDQRLAGKSPNQLPSDGSFELNLNAQNIKIDTNFADAPSALLEDTGHGWFSEDDLTLTQDFFNKSNFAHFNITARNGSVELTDKTNLHLADGASISLFGADYLKINGGIHSTGGAVSLLTGVNKNALPAAAATDLNRPIILGGNAIIDTSGNWVNDNPLLTDNKSQSLVQLWVDAGAIKLQAAGDLLLDIESSIIANGGGWIDRLGNFVAGKGGNISLSGKFIDSVDTNKTVKAAQIQLPGTLTSFSFNQGGELSITAPTIIISDLPVNEDTYPKEALVVDSRFFNRGGFSTYNLTAQGSNEWVSNFIFDGASTETPLTIKPVSLNYANATKLGSFTENAQLALLPTGSNLLVSLGTASLPIYERKPVNLNFTLSDSSDFTLHQAARLNNFIIPQGVRIEADPKANISFTSKTSLVFDGIVNAHGGNVSLTMNGSQQANEVDIDNLNDVGIWLGKNSVIDVSSSFIQTPPGADGLTAVGKVIDAGKVSLSANRGFIFAEQAKSTDANPNQKAIIDVSASAYATERYVSTKDVGAYIETTMQAAKAGTVSLKAAEGILFDGELRAQGAGYGALGGTLAVELNANNRGVPTGDLGTAFEKYDFSNISFAERKIVLTQSSGTDTRFIPAGLSSDNIGKLEFITGASNGESTFDINKLTSAGFDSYAFTTNYIETATDKQKAAVRSHYGSKDSVLAETLITKMSESTGAGRIEMSGNAALVAGRSIELNTTTLSAHDGRGIFIAPYVKLGLANGLLQVVPPAGSKNTGTVSGGKGELLLAATNLSALDATGNKNLTNLSNDLIGQKNSDILVALNSPSADGLLSLVGNIATQGADNVTLASAGDIRTTGLLVGDGRGDNARYLGSFAVNKNLTLQADQIYPTTLSEFIFSSGQYDFSKVGSTTLSLGNSLNLVNVISFTVQYTDTDGNLQTKTELATQYEAEDFIEGKLNVGDNIYRSPDQTNKQAETIIAVKNNKKAGDPAGKITILSGGKPSPVQSAAGSLIFDAPTIEQSGTVKAPFGQIVFNSAGTKGSVVLDDASLTSVSAENTTIPFGELDASGALIYNPYPNPDPKDKTFIFGVRLFNQSPEAKVTINAANVDLKASATLDLSGGGDLLSYQFVPGPGGSKDVLAAATSGKSFAIIPSISSQYAAYDPTISNESGNSNSHIGKGIGEKIYLSGSGDLPAGEYTILPARYALLAGAYLVTPTGDGQVYSQGQQVRRVDGTPVVAGRFTTANTGEYDSQLSGFIVEKGSVAQTRSEYKIAKATDLFSGVDKNGNHKFSPNDAAKLSITANASLNLEADIIAKAANKGLGAELSISSDNLLITQSRVADSSAVQVLVDQLAGFDSLLIGGSRTTNSDGTSAIKATAKSVEVAKDTLLVAPNILLVAKGSDTNQNGLVKLNTGAQVKAQGTYDQQTSVVTFFGDSLLSVSAGKSVSITQQSNSLGDVQLAKGASVQVNKGSVLLLSNNQTLLDGEINMQGGALNIGAGRVSLGQVDSTVSGLKFTNEALAKLTVDQLQLTSASSIDLFGNVNLNFTDLTLQASSVRGFNGTSATTGETNIKVNNSLTLLGNATALPANINALGNNLGKGSLSLTADKLVLGKGNLAFAGFEQINFVSRSAVVGDGEGSIQAFGNKSLILNTPLLVGTGASNTHLRADGLVQIQSSGSVSEATLSSYKGLGSRWAITGEALDFSGNAILPSGELSLSALGSNAENLSLSAGAKVDVAGRAIVFDDTSVASNGGSIKLKSASGNVILDTNSGMNISGVAGAKGSDAGSLSIQALAGQANLGGTITAASGTTSKGGSLDLSVKTITDFGKLIQQVTAGNFSEAFGLRVSTGDLTLKTTEQIKAHNISLTTDSGSITLAGVLDASGDKGQITLNASKDLNLQSTAQLLAASLLAASSNADKGGDIFIGTSNGFINIADGVKINVTGNGTVTFRAPRTLSGKIISGNQVGENVAVNLLGQQNLSNMIVGASTVDVDAVKVYDIVKATSEIFNTDVDGNSTLREGQSAILHYRDEVPSGAVCGDVNGCALIDPTSSGLALVLLPAVAEGQPLPVGALCGSSDGCSYTYTANESALSIANVETKAFMQFENAQQMEERLFGKFSLSDVYHLKPELELRAKNNLVVDHAIDFGEGLGVVQNYAGSFAFGSDEADSVWRFNDEVISKTLFDPLLGSEADYDRHMNGEAGVLSLRAQGSLSFDASVSDGFAKNISYGKLIATGFTDGARTELSDETKGWNYRFTAGADLLSANTLAILSTGQMHVADDVVLRTSTGNLKAAIASDLLLGNNAAIYTAGHATGRGVFDDITKDNVNFDNFDYSILANSTYATSGGNIDIDVGHNITASGEQSFVTDWLQRAGGQLQRTLKEAFLNNGYLPTTWTVIYEKFKQGIATLGGGDVRIDAAGNITNLSVALPTTGKNTSHYDADTDQLDYTTANSVLIQGGGDLRVSAGGDIVSGQYYVAKGKADIKAGGNIIAGQNTNALLLEVADSQINLAAGGDVNIGSILNPTVARLSALQMGSSSAPETNLSDYDTSFFTYSKDSSVSISALSGNVNFLNQLLLKNNVAPFVLDGSGVSANTNIYPAQLSVKSLQGDINVENAGITLFPSVEGALSLLAANNITTHTKAVINLPDSDPTLLPGLTNPMSAVPKEAFVLTNIIPPKTGEAKVIDPFALMHASTPLYTNNPDPVRLVTQNGDISNIRLATPTHAWITAGQDINNVTFEFQNVHESDVSIVKAVRDIIFETPRNPVTNLVDSSSATQGIDITGFGRLDVMAGRNISLGASRGIQSIGAQRNPYLLKNGFGEESGADISLFAGIKTAPDYSGFTKNYLTNFAAPNGMTTSTQLVDYALQWDVSSRANAERFMKAVSAVTHRDYLAGTKLATVSDQELGAFVTAARADLKNLPAINQQQIGFRLASDRGDQYAGDLIEFVTSSRFGGARLNAATLLALPLAEQHSLALTAFTAAPVSAQRELLLQAYFNEVKQGGVQDVSGKVTDKEKDGFARSFAAIEALFPGQTPKKDAAAITPSIGDLSLIFSTVQTQQGGDINLLMPGGGINVGVAAVGGGAKKDSSALGLIALRNGNINTTVGMDISVNSSRVFALDGGDIMLWSSAGNIDAGRGAKTALSVPPPIINEDGSVNFQAAVAGSGIRNSRFTPNRTPGAVYLFAPIGKVDAGDAGIGSQGDVLIAAQQVIGADNIDVGGVSIGIPVSTGVSAGVANAGASATAAADSSDESAAGGLSDALDNRAGAFVTVDILGFDF